MTPIKFPGCNVVFGEGQSDYQPLPALRMPDGEVITKWELSVEEIARIVETGHIYLSQLSFNNPLQPILPMIDLGDNIGLK